MAVLRDGQLVDSSAVHLLQGRPQTSFRSGMLEFLHGQHRLRGGCAAPLIARDFFDAMYGHQPEDLIAL